MSIYRSGNNDSKTGGSEHRYHFPAADCARFDEASEGTVDRSDSKLGVSERVPESCINTEGGPPRGTLAGKAYPDDKWRQGF